MRVSHPEARHLYGKRFRTVGSLKIIVLESRYRITAFFDPTHQGCFLVRDETEGLCKRRLEDGLGYVCAIGNSLFD